MEKCGCNDKPVCRKTAFAVFKFLLITLKYADLMTIWSLISRSCPYSLSLVSALFPPNHVAMLAMFLRTFSFADYYQLGFIHCNTCLVGGLLEEQNNIMGNALKSYCLPVQKKNVIITHIFLGYLFYVVYIVSYISSPKHIWNNFLTRYLSTLVLYFYLGGGHGIHGDARNCRCSFASCWFVSGTS